jgi:hypothetical protein
MRNRQMDKGELTYNIVILAYGMKKPYASLRTNYFVIVLKNIKIEIFWFMGLCSLVGWYQLSGGTCCVNLYIYPED